MGITEERCITLRCDDCGEGFGYDEGIVHYDLDDRVEMRNNAADCDWGITDEGEWCPPCWARKTCERFGHVPTIDMRGEYCDRCEEKLT